MAQIFLNGKGQSQRTHNRKGFTLTEIAIVLGIIGLILGAVWAAASAVYAGNRVKQAAADVTFMITNYRNYFSTGLDRPDTTQVTCEGVNSEFFPPNILKTIACSDGGTGATATKRPTNPWGGYYIISITKNTLATPNYNGITIKLDGLTSGQCADAMIGLIQGADIIAENINGGTANGPLPPTGAAVPWLPKDIGAKCSAAGATNNIELTYKL